MFLISSTISISATKPGQIAPRFSIFISLAILYVADLIATIGSNPHSIALLTTLLIWPCFRISSASSSSVHRHRWSYSVTLSLIYSTISLTFLVIEESLASTYIPVRILSKASSPSLVSWQVLGPPIKYAERSLPDKNGAWPWIYKPLSSAALMISIILSSPLMTPI